MNKTWHNGIIDFLPLILWAILVFPAWRWVWTEWLGNDYYTHGLLIAPLTVYLFWRSWQHGEKNEADNFGLILLFGALIFYGVMLYRQTFYGAAFASLLIAMGLIWTLFGLTTLKRVFAPILLLAIAIPLPFVERATLPLSLWAGQMSGTMANFLGLGVVINGAAITLPNANLTIGAQCSGINSLIALFTLTALAAYLLNGVWWRKLSLIFLALPLAIFGNVLRIVNLIVVARYWGVNAAFDFYHNYAGAIFFIIALLLLIPAARLLGCRTLRWDAL